MDKPCYWLWKDKSPTECYLNCHKNRKTNWASCSGGKLNEKHVALEKEKSMKAKKISQALHKYLSSFGISKEVTKGQMTKIIKKCLWE